jgi:fatty-acyl-CoA synthase
MASLAAARPMVLMASFEAEAAARLVRHHRVTHMNGSDDMFQRMLAARTEPRPFPSLRLAGFANFNPALEDVVGEAESRGLALVGLYGMSEVQALFARQRVDAEAAERARAGGFPVAPEAVVRVRDPESGALLGAGENGELELNGPSRMAGYHDDPRATAESLTADGFVRSGDLGHIAQDGSFVFLSRMGDVLRLGGFLVSPAEIESFVQGHDSVDGCQVVGISGPKGARPVAFVTVPPGGAFDEAALAAFCARGMARYKVPVRFVPLESFPVTSSANGTKIQRAKLRRMAAAIAAEAAAAPA